MISERLQRIKYLAGDFITANLAWFCYNISRYQMGGVRGFGSLADFLSAKMVVLGQMLLPLAMMAVYWLSGYYNEVYRKSRLSELIVTFKTAFFNVLLAFFVALINDMTSDNRTYNYESVLILFGLLFFLTYIVRVFITGRTSRNIKSRLWSFNTLVVGDGAAGYAFVERLNNMRWSLGYKVIGFVNIPGENSVKDITLPTYKFNELADVCSRENVRQILVIPSKDDKGAVLETINHLYALDIPISISTEHLGILGRTRITELSGEPLVDISTPNMGEGAKNVKRLFDVVASILALIILVPVYVVVAILIKCESRGPVFYSQERLGKHNKPFKIYKFRTMYDGAEEKGQPQLSSDNDPRITPLGRIMRKFRIDELPQFWNVVKGDMSLVGPRPEREYYAKQILEREPAYSLIHQVRPGITSLGQVKFGYAKNVDEMLERLRYDLLYLDNMSIINDLKIIAYTIKIVIKGRGL